MSRIGKQPIIIPDEITVKIDDDSVRVSDSTREIAVSRLPGVSVLVKNNEVWFELLDESKQGRSNWGTIRSLVANAVTGLIEGFTKTLLLEGVGYRINKEGDELVISLGYSHPIKYKEPKGISFELEKNNVLHIKGIDKALVGQVASEIRSFRKVEPYKGKGFRYSDEVVRRKAGKKAATSVIE